MTSNYSEKAISCLASITGCNPADLSPDDTIETVDKWDSLNHMRLVLHLEEILGKQLETEEAMSLFTVHAISELLEREQA